MLPARLRARRHVLPALEGLGNLLVGAAQWDEALRIFTTLIVHHRDALTDLEVVETHWQIGEIAQKLGQTERAANAFKKALEIDRTTSPRAGASSPSSRRWGTSRARSSSASGSCPSSRGREAREPRRDRRPAAIGSRILTRRSTRSSRRRGSIPTSLPVTEALLGLYRETRQGQKAADVLAQILARPEVQADPCAPPAARRSPTSCRTR